MTEHDDQASGGERAIRLRPRYYRLFAEQGVEAAEASYRYAELEWPVPLDEAALVCLDVWNYHFSRDTLERIDDITVNRIAPLVEACRRGGLQIVHAPADPVAQRHPNHVHLIPSDEEPQATWPGAPTWPPKAFREKQGSYAQYARPFEPDSVQRDRHRLEMRDFHPAVRPADGEAVILTGEELHRLCAQRGILVLIYVGFNTNACIVMRDYGTLAMHRRGYEVILVRDCTTGMETHETLADMACTRGQIATLEQFGIYTVASGQLIGALAPQ